ILMVAPLFGAVFTHLASPSAMAWASLSVPSWARWIGVAFGAMVVPFVYSVLSTFGAHIGEPDLTKQRYRLVTRGPYRRVRHPMYAAAIALFVSIGLILADGFILLWTMVVLIALRWIAIPREEARLEEMFGDEYRQYRSRTGSILPFRLSGVRERSGRGRG